MFHGAAALLITFKPVYFQHCGTTSIEITVFVPCRFQTRFQTGFQSLKSTIIRHCGTPHKSKQNSPRFDACICKNTCIVNVRSLRVICDATLRCSTLHFALRLRYHVQLLDLFISHVHKEAKTNAA